MKSLSESDKRHFEAAQGWLTLGNWLEANEELECIAPIARAHPDVLVLRWGVFAKAEKWEFAFEVAKTLVELLPDDASSWLRQAEALRKMPGGGPKDAWDSLIAVADRFPKNPAVAYSLAQYACGTGNLKEAYTWLESAMDAGGDKLKLIALDDKEFEPIWVDISEI